MKNFNLRGALIGTSLFALASIAAAQQNFVIPNNTESWDPAGDANNVILTFTATGTVNALNTTVVINSGDLTEIDTGTFVSEARARLRSSRYPGRFADIQFSTVTGITGTHFFNPGDTGTVGGTLVGGMILPGDTLTLEFFESFDDEIDAADAVWNNLNFDLQDGFVAPPTPSSFIDLGTIGAPGVSDTQTYDAAEVQWYRFSLASEVDASRFLTIGTENTTVFGTGNDTEIGLYFGDNGSLIRNDDDGGTGLTSLMNFGSTDPAGRVLPAGTYYLAVGGFNTTFAADFNVTSTSVSTGDIQLDLFTDLPAGGTAISGTCDLSDFGPDESGRSAAWELLDSNGAVVESGTTSLGAGGAYTVNVNAASGTFTFTMKASHWLKGGVENIVAGSPATANFALVNGDVDNDNEVGPGDFGALASAFLSVDGDPNWNAEADLDGDGEVGPGDFGILANNFLQAGYGA